MKLLLRNTTKNQTLRIDKLQTLLLEAAAVMNSRPLIPIETHSSDGVEPLSPAHFVAGGPIRSSPTDVSPSPVYSYSKRWSYLQRLTTNLWRRLKQEYLLLLDKISRWINKINNLAEGDVVLVKDSDLFQWSWPMGRVIKIFHGSDGLVRAVDVFMHVKTFRRPVTKLVKLLGNDQRMPPRGEYEQV